MTSTQPRDAGGSHLVDTIEEAERASLAAVRQFLDAVDEAIPGLGEDRPRRKIIDAAFRMSEQLVTASNRVARNFLDLTEKAVASEDRASKT